jgi:hypothetical protein
MKKIKIYCLLALAWLMVGSCREGSIFRKCERICNCGAGFVRFGVKDTQNRDYFEQNPHLANYDKFTVYDENWNYAIENEVGGTWEGLKDKWFVNEHYIYYHDRSEPYEKDMKKTFYVKFDEDIDTLRLEYKVKNDCLHMNYMRIYLNGNEVIPTSGSNGEQKDPNYIFPYRKK